ncbi:mandelate racemase/muconate lactonizing enzyme family protein [Shouchella clausii]|uniref:Mandelate racemase n=1 Tax=Shouchella clausii TaxID=79880 RepID=A0A268RUD1_SHOCL|nr:mandelate racemase/muconate lactonizing enzyme family protein [Shouchella clausii]PAD40687.1 mandelate racemase [Bacillus sp. 7520-S]SPU18762.1 mandelate racemase/muconate lactonizing protein [Niallia circulans]AST95442.1 mandelate racemase [Shouchella clausii]MEB5472015.1 mandelate racemase/muconate lactonizing enzyme family protein [Shouchella clausii]MEB5482429.1 mandelate racemase/muconate lactonizing enzyme family protein [Shouchella clausii]
MKIVDVVERAVPISSNIANAFIDFSKMNASIVAVKTDVIRNGKPVVGYGFNSNGRYAPSGILRERFIPRLLEAKSEDILNESGTNFSPEKIFDILMANEKPGGHGERTVAVGTLDMAIWDAVAKIEEVPLYKLLADQYGDGTIDEKVFVYAAGGYYFPGKGLPELQDEMKAYLDMGYSKVKMKVGGVPLKEDLKRIEAVIDVVGTGQNLMVDVNGRFNLEEAIEFGNAIKDYHLFWYEEAGDPLDYKLQEELSKVYPHAIATGENLFSLQDATNLIRYAGMNPKTDFLQFDCALSYGLVEYMKILNMLEENGWSSRNCIPHGGHQMSLNIAAGLKLYGNESYPGIFQPFGGFADGHAVEDGFVTLPDAPGVGFEAKEKLYDLLKTL